MVNSVVFAVWFIAAVFICPAGMGHGVLVREVFRVSGFCLPVSKFLSTDVLVCCSGEGRDGIFQGGGGVPGYEWGAFQSCRIVLWLLALSIGLGVFRSRGD